MNNLSQSEIEVLEYFVTILKTKGKVRYEDYERIDNKIMITLEDNNILYVRLDGSLCINSELTKKAIGNKFHENNELVKDRKRIVNNLINALSEFIKLEQKNM